MLAPGVFVPPLILTRPQGEAEGEGTPEGSYGLFASGYAPSSTRPQEVLFDMLRVLSAKVQPPSASSASV